MLRTTRLHAQAATAVDAISDLPLIEVPAARQSTGTIAIFLSGDGGWASIDKQIAQVFAQHGIGVVGVNSRAYLATRKSPEQAALDVSQIARAYLTKWSATRLVLIGYSRGAAMAPFVATRLPADLKGQLALIAMLGLEQNMNFQFHWTDIVRDTHRPDDVAVPPELVRLRGTPMVCVYGTEERDSPCRGADPTLITQMVRQGDHHFDGDYRALGELLVAAIPARRP
jgi:type IV secretory pathway VirJ component